MSNLIEGFKLFVGTRFLAIILVMAMVAEVFGYGAIALLPVIAGEEVLGVGAGGLGIMNGAMSLGATLGALSLASSAELRHKGMTAHGSVPFLRSNDRRLLPGECISVDCAAAGGIWPGPGYFRYP